MSIFGSLTAGISGLQAQATALGHVSDNIANARTSGYKRVDTAFNSLVLQSNSRGHAPGGVIARPNFANNVSGSIESVDRSTNLAIRGQGFFSVARLATVDGKSVPVAERFYSRDGSFELNDERILVNKSGYALNGFAFNDKTGLYATEVAPIRVTADIDSPVSTKSIDLKANLPTNPTGPIPPTNIQIFDSKGTPRDIGLNWRPGQKAGEWRLGIDSPGAIGSKPINGTLPGFDAKSTVTSTSFGQNSRAQVERVTFTTAATAPNVGLVIGDNYSVTINGKVFTQEITLNNAGQFAKLGDVSQALANQINGATPPTGITASVDINGALLLTASTAGTPFIASAAVSGGIVTDHSRSDSLVTANAPGVQEVRRSTFVGQSIDIDDVFEMTVNATTVSVRVTPQNIGVLRDMNGVAQRLAALINTDGTLGPDFIASSNGSSVNVTAKAAATAFTLASTATDASGARNNFIQNTDIGNVTGTRQLQRVSITGQPGDVDTSYSFRIRSPDFEVPNDPTETTVTVGTNNFRQYDFDFSTLNPPAVGRRYSFNLGTSSYAIQITDQNANQFPDINAVVTELANKVSQDVGANFSVVTPVTPPNLQLLAREPNGPSLASAQVRPAAFDRTIEYKTTGRESSLAEIGGLIAQKINQESSIPVQVNAIGGVLTFNANTDGLPFLVEPSVLPGTTPPHILLNFGGLLPDGTNADGGTLTAMNAANVGTGNATVSATNDKGSRATVSFNVDYGDGPQRITLNLGTFGEASGLTQFDGDTINVTSLLQDGSPQGTFKDVEIRENGDVVANYDNGRRRIISKIPIVLFNNANALSRESGNVFTETVDSGRARFNDTGLNGAGVIAASSVEGSNVDIASEFTKLIVAQRSYSANSRVITTTDQMLQETLNLKQ
ncbi:MAG TPA: flagellar hook-basal body complex protein [Azospirillaceae bacterium]|nr:flagellar hook-basal body complex protein [Azospirillaceae bacterium]